MDLHVQLCTAKADSFADPSISAQLKATCLEHAYPFPNGWMFALCWHVVASILHDVPGFVRMHVHA
jgi:hypothetical protein